MTLLQGPTAQQATIIAATVGAVAGLVGGLIAAIAQRRLESAKWPRGREDALASDLRTTISGLITNIASGLHSICWLTWDLDHRPGPLQPERIATYDADMHGLLPRLLGGVAAVATIDKETAVELRVFVENIIEIDYKIGVATLAIHDDPEGARAQLREQFSRAAALERELLSNLMEISTQAVERRAARLLKTGHASG
jgi:hypothetical protein